MTEEEKRFMAERNGGNYGMGTKEMQVGAGRQHSGTATEWDCTSGTGPSKVREVVAPFLSFKAGQCVGQALRAKGRGRGGAYKKCEPEAQLHLVRTCVMAAPRLMHGLARL